MMGAHSYNTVCVELAAAFRGRYASPNKSPVRMVGLLFARPTSALAAQDIVPNLDYFHHRSASHVDFFCSGYGMFWEIFRDKVPDMQVVARVGNRDWLFSAQMFDLFRQEIEQHSTWRYGGGVELLLANAQYYAEESTAKIDFASAVVVDLDRAQKIDAFPSVEHFFEDIVRYVESSPGDDPTWGFSDRMGRKVAGSALRSLVLRLLPEAVRADAERAAHFVVRNLSEPPSH